MHVNEAPWLTRKVEVIIMIAVFLLCFVSDMFKCKHGRTTNCVGGSPLCDRDVENPWCTDMVLPFNAAEDGKSHEDACGCRQHNNSLLLLHIVDVGAPVARTRMTKNIEPIRLAPLVVSTLQNKIGNVIFTNTNGGLFGSEVFTPLREDIGLSPPRTSNCTPVTNEINISYSYDTVAIPVKTTFSEDIRVLLPFKDDFFAIRRILPGLYHVFEKLLSRRSSFSTDKGDPCRAVHLVIVINLLPGADASWVNDNATLIPHALIEAQTYVRKTISRYLRKKPRYTRLLKSLWYVSVPIGYPVHASLNVATTNPPAFTANKNTTARSIGVGEMTSVDDLVLALCHTAGAQRKVCIDRCKLYEREVSSYQVANAGLLDMTAAGGQRIGLHSILVAYRDYFQLGSTGAQASNWWDCLYLSAEGARMVARNVAEGLCTF